MAVAACTPLLAFDFGGRHDRIRRFHPLHRRRISTLR